MDKLQPDALLNIFKNNDTKTPFYVQAHQAKNLADGVNRIRMMINDGKWYLNAVFKPSEQQQVLEGFEKFAIIHVTNFSMSGVNGKYFILLNECKVVANPEKSGANFQNLDHYLRDNPAENVFQRTLDEAAAAAAAATTTAETKATPQPSVTPTPTSTPQPTAVNVKTQTPAPTPHTKSSAPPPKFRGLTTIDQLSPYQSAWSIKARVSYKGDMRTWSNTRGTGKLFSVHFMDETGEIKATAFNQVAEKFYDVFKENHVYYISKATLQQAKKQFSNLSNDYEINFDRETLVEPCTDDADVPQMHFDFVKLDQISTLENNTVIDVLGIIKDVGELKEITSKSTGKAYSRRDVTLVDQSQTAVNVGLWNKMAREFSLNNGTPIAFKGCKVNDFQGKQLSLIPSALILANPDIPEAYKLKGWYDNEGSSEHFTNLRSSGGTSTDLTSIDAISQRVTIDQVSKQRLGFNDQADYFSMKATVTYVRPENFSYPACCSPDCAKKVVEQTNGTWRCEKCSIDFPEPDHRYILTVSVVDETGQMWLNLFNEEGKTLMGCDAKTLLEMKENIDDTLLKNYLTDNVLFKEYAFRVRARVDSYQGVERARFQGIGLSEVKPANEADALVTLLDKLQV